MSASMQDMLRQCEDVLQVLKSPATKYVDVLCEHVPGEYPVVVRIFSDYWYKPLGPWKECRIPEFDANVSLTETLEKHVDWLRREVVWMEENAKKKKK